VETFIYITLILFLAGLIGGLLSGLLGIGGGVIYVFVLTQSHNYLYQNESELGHFVIANSLFVIFFSTLSSTLLFRKNKLYYPKEIIRISIPSILALLLLTKFFVSTTYFKPKVFNTITLLILVYILISSLIKIKQKKQSSHKKQLSNSIYYISGILSGTMASLTGLGGGTILNPILNGKYNLDLTTTRSISLGVIMLSSLAITIFNLSLTPSFNYGYFTVGFINFSLCIPLAIGSLVTSQFGVRLGNKLNSSTIIQLFSLFITFLIFKRVIELIT